MMWRETHQGIKWTVPYLPIDPKDLGREYDADVIRINSQSGKGGIGFVLEQAFGIRLPVKMREEVGYAVKDVSDREHKELSPEEVRKVFEDIYMNVNSPIKFSEVHYRQENGIHAELRVYYKDRLKIFEGQGNGRLDAVSNALQNYFKIDYTLMTYEEHALEVKSSSKACTYVAIEGADTTLYWGVGVDDDIIVSSVRALLSAVNRFMTAEAEAK
jgi:2-isopropylmalate synthase